ncbi:2Fe-2S iron-sulfur cluster-binding protein [Litorivivens sp.]|uniref:2Fe-2S iron-sulfur cluster-binding protein n=1 Tax=Litorivivens sp. TaxID=2020868 RepID=UPI003568B79D
MPLLIFRDANGNQFDVEAEIGDTVMQAAMNAGIDGILAECGGMCSCATCHVYIEDARFNEVPQASPTEREMLDAASEPQETSRLSCQITVTAEMEGMVFTTPASQY